jgi:hypothetical protein
MTSIYDRMTVAVPEGSLDGMRVERFTIPKSSMHNTMNAFRGRGTTPGTYTRLTDRGRLWMSDVDAEKGDHYEAVQKIETLRAQRVLINGLGLGMVLQAALSFNHVRHVDVVEKDHRVIKLVGPYYERDHRVTIHRADAYEQAASGWERGTRWDVGWSDIWADLCTDNLPDMQRLNRSYGRRCRWHGCWVQDRLNHQRQQERRYESRWS